MLNSGGANCFTGSFGFQTTHQTAEKAAELLGVSAGDVLICSTGLIGTGDEVFRAKVLAGTEQAIAELSADGGEAASARHHDDGLGAEALASSARDGWSIGGMAKGAGMLAPGLATMLVVITTDAVLDAARGRRRAAARDRASVRPPRLGRLHVDERPGHAHGERSFAASVPIRDDVPRPRSTEICHDLATQLQGDAEGASHDITIEVVRRGIRSRCGRGRPLGRPQQPLQGGDLRQRPQLGPRPRRDRHDRARSSTRTTSTSG